jgi:arginine decarboxylase
MEFSHAFPISIIDEDYEGKSAAGRGMQQLAAAIEKEGYRVVAGVSYEDARRLVNVFNSESCWLISVDGAEATPKQWQVLEEVLATKRRRNDRLPIFLFGDERTAEMVPASVLKHANAFIRLFEDSAEFMARAITRAAQLYIERLPPPMFKALMDYPPGIPLIMPGERITPATKSIHDYLLYAREFDQKFPGFETEVHGLRFEPAAGGRRYLLDCVAEGAER